MGFVRILTSPVGMERFLVAVDEIDLDLLARFSSVREFVRNHLKAQAAEAESRRAIVQLINDGVDPKITAYLFMRVVLEEFLLDGEYHAQAGKLTFDGEHFLAIYNNIVRELRVLNWYSAMQVDEHDLPPRLVPGVILDCLLSGE